jgi:hypothetical protein
MGADGSLSSLNADGKTMKMRIIGDANVRDAGSAGVISPSLPLRTDISLRGDGGRCVGSNARRCAARATTIHASVGQPRLGIENFFALRTCLILIPG